VPNRSIANGSAALANAMGYYDPNNMFFIEELFRKGIYETFFDIGSNVGVYSLIVAGCAEKAKVLAFEPHPYTFSVLVENVRLNQKEHDILCYQLALGDQNGKVLFRDKAGHPENRVLDLAMPGVRAVEVTARRGDDFCKELGVQPPRVMKIDVEGHENRVLAGFSSVLGSIDLVFVECWELETTINLLCENSVFLGPYKVDYKNRRFVSINSNYEDWVFINKRALHSVQNLMAFE
jgi:FkbM family methyltransferase